MSEVGFLWGDAATVVGPRSWTVLLLLGGRMGRGLLSWLLGGGWGWVLEGGGCRGVMGLVLLVAR